MFAHPADDFPGKIVGKLRNFVPSEVTSDIIGKRIHRGITVLGIEFSCFVDNGFQFGIDFFIGNQMRHLVDIAVFSPSQFFFGIPDPCRFQGNQFVKYDSQRENIACHADIKPSFCLFRRHIAECADNALGLCR